MLLLGLTGSIASGKSTVAAHIAAHWASVIYHLDADAVAHRVSSAGFPAYYDTIARFGREILKDDGSIDREKLGPIVFSDPSARRALNAITHPRIFRAMLRETIWAFLLGYRICLWDVPLLIEGNLDKWMNVIAVVFCSPEQQLDRLMNRNGFSREAAEQRIASQLALPQKLARATHQIDNSGSREDTLQQVDTMMDSIVPGRIRTGFWWTILAGPALFAYGVLAAWDFGDQAITRLRTRSVIAKDKKM